MAFNWKGFDTFILDTTFGSNINKKRNAILYIFANKLYNCTSVTDYNFRLLNAYVNNLDVSISGNTFKGLWDGFIANMKTVADINGIANMLLVLIDKNTDAAKKITPDGIYDTTAGTHINTINIGELFKNAGTGANADTVAANIKAKVDTMISNIEGIVLFDWNGFDNIFEEIKEADARTYICNYFISELSTTKIANANKNTDAFILLMYIIKKNKDATKGDVDKLHTAVSNDGANTLINTIAEKLKYLFEYTDINTNIDTKTKDALKCFKYPELVPVTPAHALPTFNKDKLPSGWANYELLNVLSYDVAVDDATKRTTLPNIRTFLANIVTNAKIPGTAYNEFAPNIITLQNTAESIKLSPIVMPNYKVKQNTDNTLVTIIHDDIYSNKEGNDKADGDNFYQYSFNATLKYIIINVVNPTSTISSSTINGIFTAIHGKIKYDPKTFSCLLVISGAVSGDFERQLTKPHLNLEKLVTIYDRKDITNLHIYTTKDFDEKYLFNFGKDIGPPVNFTKDYSKSLPVGVRLFLKLDSTKLTSSKPKPTGVTMGNVHDVLGNELDGLDVGKLTALLKSISAPIGKAVKGKSSSKTKGKTPVAATPPPATPTTNVQSGAASKLMKIDFAAAKAATPSFDYSTYTSGIDKSYVNVLVKDSSGKDVDKTVTVTYAKGKQVDGILMGKGKGPYNLQFKDDAGNIYNVHDLNIFNDKKGNNKIIFKDTTSGSKSGPDLTPYATFSK